MPTYLPSFPRKRESRAALAYKVSVSASNLWIPAYAGRTVGRRGLKVGGGEFPLTGYSPFQSLLPGGGYVGQGQIQIAAQAETVAAGLA